MPESLHDALTREMIEETGVKPITGHLILVQQFTTNGRGKHGESEQLEFIFKIENADDYSAINLEATSHGEQEVTDFGFVDPQDKNMLLAILQTTQITYALESKEPVIFYSQLD